MPILRNAARPGWQTREPPIHLLLDLPGGAGDKPVTVSIGTAQELLLASQKYSAVSNPNIRFELTADIDMAGVTGFAPSALVWEALPASSTAGATAVKIWSSTSPAKAALAFCLHSGHRLGKEPVLVDCTAAAASRVGILAGSCIRGGTIQGCGAVRSNGAAVALARCLAGQRRALWAKTGNAAGGLVGF